MAYKPYKMRGHTLPGIKQRESSPAKQKKEQQQNRGEIEEKNREKKEKRRKEIKEGMLNPVNPYKRKYNPHTKEKKSPAKQKDVHPEERKTVDIRPKKGFKESEAKRVEGEKYTGTRSKGGLKPLTDKERVQKKSPAKIAPLIAMAGKALIGSAVSGMMKKKEEE